ncbi:hypothetical protein [Haladaptatus caseinilyticus]|uniref:hypothetical protein n=1 Tax=Haladaptatus caseinilyticus TaxID=2993314 RepID=UPI00224B27A7|nr:hypothetical protein [Haladaptatus caseinilyticus]
MGSHGERQTDSLKTSENPQSSQRRSHPPMGGGCRISWNLGDHLRRLDTVTLTTELTDSRSRRTLSVYDPDGDTYLVRLQTPVGRERYREVPKSEFDLDELSRGSRWTQTT